MTLEVLKILLPTFTAFFVGIALTPFVTHFLYKNRLWKKKAGKISPDGKATPLFDKLHAHKEVGTPRMGGIIIWGSVLITISLIFLLSLVWPEAATDKLNFLSRNQTWLPFFTLIVASLIGLIDDILQIKASENPALAGLAFWKRLLLIIVLGGVGGYWFYFKLGLTAITIPFYGPLTLGILIIPLFILVMISLFSSGVIDGLDGLAGGVMAIIFSTYAFLAFYNNQFDLAAFCGVVAGGILAFLWFNIPPARFYMSETGILGLTTTLTVVAFLTDSVAMLPIIALPLTATALSNVIQLTSKKLFNRKVFKIAPLHHHFEASGWPASKVVMRYWVITVMAALLGIIITMVGK
jgi:phospho-N-acetylmuramoyl-pentapeptide-transferase